MLAEGLHAAGDGITSRFVARLDQELAVGDQLLLGQGYPVNLALRQLGHQVVLRVLTSLIHHLLEVAVQLTPGPHRRLLRALAGASILRIILPDDLVGPAEEPLPVDLWHAEHPGDHGDGEGSGEHLDEVAFRNVTPGRALIDDANGDALDLLAPGMGP